MNNLVVDTIEIAREEGRAPWTDLVAKSEHFWIFLDGYAVTEGHTLFVPVKDTYECIMECYKAAYNAGQSGLLTKDWDGFNVGQNIGRAAGQTCMYPHIHMIPRRIGDMEDPRGGVRHVIPEKGNYKKA